MGFNQADIKRRRFHDCFRHTRRVNEFFSHDIFSFELLIVCHQADFGVPYIMEVVGAAASVAGIVAFAGQALGGLITIKTLVEAIKDAPKGFITILSDIEALEGTLRAMSSLIEKTSAISVVNLELSSMIGIVHSHLKTCCAEVSSWNAEIAEKQVHPQPWRSFVKRVAHVGHKDSLEKLAKRISGQQSTLSLDLSTLGR